MFSRRNRIILKASDDSPAPGDKLVYDTKSNRFYEAELDDKAEVAEFTLIDKATGQPILLTRVWFSIKSYFCRPQTIYCVNEQEEKERIFLDAIQSYYFSGKSGLPDEQFDRLREDLSWEASLYSLRDLLQYYAYFDIFTVGVCVGDVESKRNSLFECHSGRTCGIYSSKQTIIINNRW